MTQHLVSLGRFLVDHPKLAIEQQSIHQMRSRAKKMGKEDPFPWLISRGRGRPVLVNLEAYNMHARQSGRPVFEISDGRRGR